MVLSKCGVQNVLTINRLASEASQPRGRSYAWFEDRGTDKKDVTVHELCRQLSEFLSRVCYRNRQRVRASGEEVTAL